MSNDLQIQLDELNVAIQQTAQLIVKLSKTQSSDDADPESASDLVADIREALHNEEEQLELVKQDVDEIRGSGDQARRKSAYESTNAQECARLNAYCTRLIDDLKTQRSRFRRANLQSKKNQEQALQFEQEAYLAELRASAEAIENSSHEAADKHLSQAEMRGSLFAGRRGANRSNPTQTKDDMVLSASSDLTSSLRRTQEMLSSELSRSRFAQETLNTSNAALKELNERYGTLDDLLSRSRGLLGTLLRSQKSDTWFLETTMWMLIITIGWLIFRRLLYGPLWWLAWIPLKFAYNIIAFIVGSSARTSLTPAQKPSFRGLDLPQIMQASRLPEVHINHDHPTMYNGEEGPMTASVGQMIDSSQTMVYATPAATVASEATDGSSEDNNPAEQEQEVPHAAQAQDKSSAQDQQQGEAEVRRADGTVLRPRDPVQEPPNPKKRVFEEAPPRKQKRDEL